MADAKEVAPEKVDKTLKDTGEVVQYYNNFLPNKTEEMPKADWDRLKAENLITNLTYVGIKEK